ncbi:hypothetical protein ACVXHA_00940 [Escherichia coli]
MPSGDWYSLLAALNHEQAPRVYTGWQRC